LIVLCRSCTSVVGCGWINAGASGVTVYGMRGERTRTRYKALIGTMGRGIWGMCGVVSRCRYVGSTCGACRAIRCRNRPTPISISRTITRGLS
jgi:hypothetical protein